MGVKYPLSVHRGIGRQWAERIKSLRQFRGQIVVATQRMLQRVFDNDGSLNPVRVRTAVDQRRLDRPRPRD